MASSNSIQWGRILLSAVLAAVISLLLIFLFIWLLGQAPNEIIDKISPKDIVDCWDDPNIGTRLICPIIWGIACAIEILFYSLIIYFPLAIVISIILIKLMVHQRQLIHIILTALISIPVALLLLIILNVLFD
ncbi:MAG: hypothetical protein JSW07_03770 [bacterium]|nr:MAG: hypothetical protein JSW07_03770 [bacterium]